MKKIFVLLITLLLISGCSKEIAKEELISKEELQFKGCWNLFATEEYIANELVNNKKDYTDTTLEITDTTINYCFKKIDNSIKCKYYSYSLENNILNILNPDKNILNLEKFEVIFERGLFNNFMRLESYTDTVDFDYIFIHFNSIPCK